MRLVLVCFASLILGAAPLAFPAAPAPLLKEPALQENFYGVHILDNRAWVVGYYGTILHSSDRGVTWKLQRSPTRSSLFRVRFPGREKGWISGSYGALLYTADGGNNWSAQPTGTTEQLFGLTSINEHTGWAVGSRGTILHTEDGGRSWINSSLSEDLTFSDIAFVNPNRGWIVGEFGVIFQTQNGGKSWNKQKSPVEVSFVSGESRNLFALLFPEPKNGWAFGLDGIVLKTRGGSSWEIVREKKVSGSANGANHLFSAATSNGRLWAVGERGTVLRSDADGSTWRQAVAEAPPVSLNGIAFGKDGFGLIVGNRGLILRTEDGGTTWKRLRIVLQAQGKEISRTP
jgi:photosystem II stability/assembly factor-like uncharacterized protein